MRVLTAAFILFSGASLFAQRQHFVNTSIYQARAKVTGRTTWNMKDTVQLISIDQYDGNGHKTEAYEFYYGKRTIQKFVNSDWREWHDTTHYSFEYDARGLQIKQIFHDFPNRSTDSYHMFRYDEFGNIERWNTGRSFQLAHEETRKYDQFGYVSEEQSCWDDTCGLKRENVFIYNGSFGSKHYLKYNEKNLLIEDLMNYFDGMAGYQYEYKFGTNGKLINIKKIRVWSYFGLDHEVPTSKDIDRTDLFQEWKFEYNAKGILVKETRLDHWTESHLDVFTFIYNDQGLITESASGWGDVIKFTYNDQGLVQEEKHYKRWETEDKLWYTLKFEYAYQY